MTRRKRKRKLTLVGKLLIAVIIIAPIILITARCTAPKENTSSDAPKQKPVTNTLADIFDAATDSGDTMSYAVRNAQTKQLDVESKYGILINIDDNAVVADKNGDEKIYPASMTKVMTLIVAAENIEDVDSTFTVTAEIIDPLVAEEASRAGFEPNETVTLNDLLYGAILPSGADATIALAEYVAGSESDFVALMNEKANKMGLKNTHFMNSSGLHDEYHYSTPHEMALIMQYAMENELCKKVLSTYTYTTTATAQHPEGIELYSTMFSRMYGNEAVGVNIIAGKTGYTTEGGNCLVSYAETTDGKKYILVTTDAEGSYRPIYDAIEAYAQYVGDGETNITIEQVDSYAY